MKRTLVVFILSVSILGCSKSPLDKLESYKASDSSTHFTQEDEAYWTKAAEDNTKEFQEAVSYCKKQNNFPSTNCFIIDTLDAPKVQYGQYPLRQPRF